MMPPAISVAIMTVQSAITPQARRSLRAWPRPRKTWLCVRPDAAWSRSLMRSSVARCLLQVGVHHVDKLLGRAGIERGRVLLRSDQVIAHVILDHLGHQPGDGAADADDLVHDGLAARLAV